MTARWTEADYQQAMKKNHPNFQAKPKRSKYGAVKTVVNGITFDSKREAERYRELVLLVRAGEISELELQPVFVLWVGSVKIGAYRADFSYERGGRAVIEDVKGVRTAIYQWKKKHVEAQYGIRIVEIT